VLNIDIDSGCLEQFLIFVSPKDRGNCQLKFCFGKARLNSSVQLKSIVDNETYCMPTHCLDPFENETRYRSSGGAPSGRFSSQRSGLNLFASGKMVSFWWMWTDVMPTGV
jgi:hypothetical protein